MCLLPPLLFVGCRGEGSSQDLVAGVGTLSLTRGELEALAGVPLDSLTESEQGRLIQDWVERAMVEQEGRRLKLDGDEEIQQKLTRLRTELFRARLLSDLDEGVPSDSMVEAYYEEHKSEFLRTRDTYLIELFWSDSADTLRTFRERMLGDPDRTVEMPGVFPEGRWLAESGEIDEDLEREIKELQAGAVTKPRPAEDGFRIVRLVETYPAGTVLNLEAVKEEIVRRLVMEQSRQRNEELMRQLRNRYPVTIYVEERHE